ARLGAEAHFRLDQIEHEQRHGAELVVRRGQTKRRFDLLQHARPVSRQPSTAAWPVSPVRMRKTVSRSQTQTLPSPILPVLAALAFAPTIASPRSGGVAPSPFTFGSNFTSYSAPR